MSSGISTPTSQRQSVTIRAQQGAAVKARLRLLTDKEKGARKVASLILAHQYTHMHISARPSCKNLVARAPDFQSRIPGWQATGFSPVAGGGTHGLPTTAPRWRPATTTWWLRFRPSRAAPVTASSPMSPTSAHRGRAAPGRILCHSTHGKAPLPHRKRWRRRATPAGTACMLEARVGHAETGPAQRRER